MAVGLGLFAFEPVSGSCLMLAGLNHTITGRTESLEVLFELNGELQKLKHNWERMS